MTELETIVCRWLCEQAAADELGRAHWDPLLAAMIHQAPAELIDDATRNYPPDLATAAERLRWDVTALEDAKQRAAVLEDHGPIRWSLIHAAIAGPIAWAGWVLQDQAGCSLDRIDISRPFEALIDGLLELELVEDLERLAAAPELAPLHPKIEQALRRNAAELERRRAAYLAAGGSIPLGRVDLEDPRPWSEQLDRERKPGELLALAVLGRELTPAELAELEERQR